MNRVIVLPPPPLLLSFPTLPPPLYFSHSISSSHLPSTTPLTYPPHLRNPHILLSTVLLIGGFLRCCEEAGLGDFARTAVENERSTILVRQPHNPNHADPKIQARRARRRERGGEERHRRQTNSRGGDGGDGDGGREQTSSTGSPFSILEGIPKDLLTGMIYSEKRARQDRHSTDQQRMLRESMERSVRPSTGNGRYSGNSRAPYAESEHQ